MKKQIGQLLGAVIGTKLAADRGQRSMTGALIGLGAAALARRSLPGALIVGGAMLAKELMDRKHRRDAQARPAKPKAKTSTKKPASTPKPAPKTRTAAAKTTR